MQTIGEILRAERTKKGLSVKDVESAINIRALYLNAIEEGNYSIIPGEVYLKGFIRNYAAFLELNAQQIMEVYRQSKGQDQEEDGPGVAAVEMLPAPPAANRSGGLAKWVTLAIVAAGVVAGVAWWSSGSQAPAPSPPSVARQESPTAQQPPLQTVPQNQPVKPADKVSVTATYKAQCWTQIMADGKEVYQGMPQNGESFTWEATNKLIAKFGNAGAVDLVYNGSPVGKIGGSGDVVVKSFTVSGITQ